MCFYLGTPSIDDAMVKVDNTMGLGMNWFLYSIGLQDLDIALPHTSLGISTARDFAEIMVWKFHWTQWRMEFSHLNQQLKCANILLCWEHKYDRLEIFIGYKAVSIYILSHYSFGIKNH